MNDARTPTMATGACGHQVNSNGNCFVEGCWNSNDNRNKAVTP